ncbi:DNA-binding LacI/PurR family transcriptional regulator [Amycolatopsis bartoniae]|uniref:LacI family transcriptional regulator n=1 Tax=Amycolatopsis bartoniae TaxID=941986 RepID=A0A8H9IVL1_9PSEU|nr:LacI family DNA-binding transcriptional regulator [Amycolatopsis bartoniae]MBB2940073.1 DNA-binding LacI/PurR family transcriptional regulator [Amycolatopsis bartoniae]TVT09448.1 LacI family transcriptional regulator [Amycolatopsis bartoniae]GHF53760.1 LacI family transcriptional regulator [Amycolatopsis bartoniae]
MVTINDVARAAGVAPSTVSYVLSGKRSISAETRRLVEQSIRRLGYHPHAGARALASSKTQVLALVIPLRTDLNVAVVMQFVAAVTTAARRHDHDVLLLTKDEGADGLKRVVGSALADALLVMDVESADPRVPMLLALDRPVVLIGTPDHATGLSCVDLDFQAAGAVAVRHLAELGHASAGLVGPSPAVYERGTSFADRFLRGFHQAAADAGLRAGARPCGHSYEQTRACLDELFAENPDLTALVVQNEAVLGPVLSDLRQRGLRVPEDVSVLAVCPDSMAGNHAVTLTTITIPADEIGELAVAMTMSQLGGEATPETRLLSPRLTRRESTAPPPR